MGIKLKQMNTYTHGHRHREARTGSSQKSTVTNPSKGDRKSLSKISFHVDTIDNSRVTSDVKGVSILAAFSLSLKFLSIFWTIFKFLYFFQNAFNQK